MQRLVVLAASAVVLAHCGFNRPAVTDAAFAKPVIDHTNFASNCVSCHEAERPAPVDVTPHGKGQECSVCHKFIATDPIWLSLAQFSHAPAPTSCLACHGSLRPKANPHPDTTADCAGCHAFPSFSSGTTAKAPS